MSRLVKLNAWCDRAAVYLRPVNRFLLRFLIVLTLWMVGILAIYGIVLLDMHRRGELVTRSVCDQRTDEAVRGICEACLCREDPTFCRIEVGL